MKTIIRAKWTQKTRNYYEKRGYTFTNYEDYFVVNDSDFSCNSKLKIQVQCIECGKFFDMSFRSYYNRKVKHIPHKCNQCNTKDRADLWYQKILKICKEQDYLLITKKEEIKDKTSKIFYICPMHGETCTTLRSLLEGKRCYWCGRKNATVKQTQTTLSQRQDKLYQAAMSVAKKKRYELLSKKEDIVNNTSYIYYQCSKHGVHSMRVSNFITGKGCPDCARENNSVRFRLSPDEVELRITKHGGKLLNKHDYINQSTKNLLIECFECGEPFLTSLHCFTQHNGQVCNNCSDVRSVGEKRIKSYLENRRINFVEQKWFDECRDINPLPFDFYLPEPNIIIEFDGRQHFEETEYFTYPLSTVQRHDDIKNSYCQQNGIKMIRIPYWNINKIQVILDEQLILHEDIV